MKKSKIKLSEIANCTIYRTERNKVFIFLEKVWMETLPKPLTTSQRGWKKWPKQNHVFSKNAVKILKNKSNKVISKQKHKTDTSVHDHTWKCREKWQEGCITKSWWQFFLESIKGGEVIFPLWIHYWCICVHKNMEEGEKEKEGGKERREERGLGKKRWGVQARASFERWRDTKDWNLEGGRVENEPVCLYTHRHTHTHTEW